MSVDLGTGGAQATRLIGKVHQSWLVGTDELYSEREAFKARDGDRLISIPLFPLPPPSLSSSAPVPPLFYKTSKHILHRATPRLRRGVALHLTYRNWVRQRVDSGRVDSGCRAVCGLPKNFYDVAWLQTLSSKARADLRMQPEISLEHSPAVKR